VVAIGAVLLQHRKPAEPSLNGRPLSAWLQIADHFNNTVLPDPTRDAEAEAAIRQIGTSALPLLTDWIRLESSSLREKLETAVVELPGPLAGNATVRRALADTASFRVGLAIRGFRTLKDAAVPAIPRLTQILNCTNSPTASCQAAAALGYLGPQALKPLQEAALRPGHPARRDAVYSLDRILTSNPEFRPQMGPTLIPLARDQDADVADAAFDTLVLFSQTEHAAAALAMLTNTLSNAKPDFRRAAAQMLEEFSAEAAMATPALRIALADEDAAVRCAATNTLLHIAPESLRK
jgi:HEAT repeat protein